MKTHVNDEKNELGYDENACNRKENARCYGVQRMGKMEKSDALQVIDILNTPRGSSGMRNKYEHSSKRPL